MKILNQEETKRISDKVMFAKPYDGSPAIFHGLPVSFDGERAGHGKKAPKIGEHNGKA